MAEAHKWAFQKVLCRKDGYIREPRNMKEYEYKYTYPASSVFPSFLMFLGQVIII